MKKIVKTDPYLAPYEALIDQRQRRYLKKKRALLGGLSIEDFANGYLFFGFHRMKDGWVYREWAPSADMVYLTGDFVGWDPFRCNMERRENGVFEIFLSDRDGLRYGQRVQTVVMSDGKLLRRVPSYATRVIQDPTNFSWCAELENTMEEFPWTDTEFRPSKKTLIYEAHIGMAQEKCGVGSYREFTENILPRIKSLGYNVLQLMAIMEHPYYASFGYQVSSFFAPSSRYGKSRDLKELVNKAHEMGIAVILDLVHSHAIYNSGDGLNEFDGTEYQYFHAGSRGYHPAWGTKLFDYGKNQVLHFLLSNLKYWMEIFHFDGFRFDGVTSMLYRDHGLGKSFFDYSTYFSENTDVDAVIYLQLANELVHQLNKRAITVAEDMSGMPGMCLPISCGGLGFDYRLSMGVPDMWIKTLKEKKDEEWDLNWIWSELTSRRPKEKNIGYCESHDQALVGDKTIMFRLCDAEMYNAMIKGAENSVIDRGVALHKMIRLITATLAGEGYLNFMGNEFGHPEWIDFPREGNGWSYHYCRRQWSLSDDPNLRYSELMVFDREMIAMLKKESILSLSPQSVIIDQADNIVIYSKGDIVFAYNFDPSRSFEKVFVKVERAGKYKVILDTDEKSFGGFGRSDDERIYEAESVSSDRNGFYCYLPSRSALVFKRKRN